MPPIRRFIAPLAKPLAAAVLIAAQAGAAADTAPEVPRNIVSLTAQASVEVQKDWLTVVFATSRDGPEAAAVQAQLRQALDAALAEARKAARPGQIEVRTGAFALYPRQAPKGGIAGWQGSTELVVEGRDFAGISQLTARLPTLTIARVQFSLSREAREAAEADVSTQAIARFRARADAVSQAFGFGGYALREASVAGDAPVYGGAMMRAGVPAMAAEGALPVEAGRSLVTVTVSGSVQMR